MGAPRFQLANWHVIALKAFIHLACLYFLIDAYYRGFTDRLGGDPVDAIIHFTGTGALNLLLLTLLVTPLSRWTRQGRLIRVRRLLGLYCFTYALAHFVNYISFELQYDWQLVAGEIVKRPYIIVGLITLLILFTLAVTSLPALVRRLGRRWKPLHRSIYVAVLLACLHFFWSVKAELTQPLIYTVLACILLLARRRELWRRPRASHEKSRSIDSLS